MKRKNVKVRVKNRSKIDFVIIDDSVNFPIKLYVRQLEFTAKKYFFVFKTLYKKKKKR